MGHMANSDGLPVSTLQETAIKRRQLRSALRRARRRAGLSHQQVARAMDWSTSKVIRMENGTSNVQPSDVRLLLTHYGADASEVASLFDIARYIRINYTSDWKEPLLQIHSQAFINYLEYEQTASTVLQFHPTLVPGLLQTEEYAREVLSKVFKNSPSEIDKRIEARKMRQRILDVPGGPSFHFILDESTTRRPLESTTTMIQQLERVNELNRASHIKIQLLPFSAGLTPGMRGPFNILEFEDEEEHDVLYIENTHGDSFSRDSLEITGEYVEIFGELEELALEGGAVDELIKQRLERLGMPHH
jgi:transcriptional regulator with XRE-family HTH domain